MKKKTIISFDLDNTLVEPAYTTFVWEKGMPQLYAQRHHMSIEDATQVVLAAYEKMGDTSLEWYDISYWFTYFDLQGSWQYLLEKHRNKIQAFPEVREVIDGLAPYYELIILSNAAREFVEFEIREAHIEHSFSKVFSATSDFKQVKKTTQFYRQICEIMETEPSAMLHIGDHYTFDYVIPKRIGIESYFLDRDGKRSPDGFTVRNLKEFADLMKIPPESQ